MSRLALTLALAALPAVAGCSDDSDEPVDAVSPTEAKALDEAAEMIEQRRLPPEAVADTGAANEKPAEGEAK
ncbi:hypothetical protein [Erythrobacter mangrovi]|uniref:Secreted protein n=1 Tax=Erythrobacter mangrovi TaxID=2739433 RepID=A0A7D4BA92_9SPHN|nr:hypothetical protein [Erythrobacter mangrovi]QKG70746.1 hypothetical protein HQR01_04825 [Erythrobacter mangrovi]